MEIKSFSIVEFVRYVLSGLNAIAFLLIVPIIFCKPTLLELILNSSSVLSLILFAVAIGFLLDILKIYQLTPKYRVKQIEFFKELAHALDVPFDQAPTYFSVVTQLSKKKGIYDLERRHSEWILTVNTAMVFYLSIIIWICLLIRELIEIGITKKLFALSVILIFSFISALRLFYVGSRERVKSKSDYILFASQNKEHIVNSLKVEIKLIAEEK